MVRALFALRRKTIANGLRGPAGDRGLAPGDVIARAGLDPARRPEQLSVPELLTLAAVLEGRD
jgi:16S rRNA A1518/A1519 N6-dimethyltransferase RsmA/KsgA/DIM1 with predicted DNA glycosylase/AP lyase activity